MFSGKTGNSIQLISPGELSKAHKELGGISQCFKCHTLTKGITDSACRACHEKLNKRIEENKGFHARVKADCVKCHIEHKGEEFDITSLDKETFDHNMTGFELQDSHIGPCSKCHIKENTYLGLSPECLNCHTDVHGKTVAENCTGCHNFKDWKDYDFDHERDSGFRLTGKHTEIKCDKCHTRYSVKKEGDLEKVYQVLRFKPLKHGGCDDCHKDIHKGQLKEKPCIKCHSTRGWKETVFNHNDPFLSSFKLLGRHKEAACELCHAEEKRVFMKDGKKVEKTGIRLKPVKHDYCRDCHYDVHEGQFKKQKCSSCHSPERAWKEYTFSHLSDKYRGYKPKGRHKDVECLKCHERNEIKYTEFKMKKKVFIGRFKPCESDVCTDCHYDIHKGQFAGKNCDTCHSQDRAWKEHGFSHNSKKYSGYKPEGRHKDVECVKCHERSEVRYTEFNVRKNIFIGRFKPLKADLCSDCHYDVHKGQFVKQQCDSCHTPEEAWKDYIFRHESEKYSGYKPEGRHKEVDCGKCHERSEINYKEFGSNKKRIVARFKPLKSEFCVDCHYDVHKAQFGKDQCSSCHSQEKLWKEYTFRHDSEEFTGFKLEGKHKEVDCGKCHERSEIRYREFRISKKTSLGIFKITKSDLCSDCHKPDHKGAFKDISEAEDLTCASCHSVEKAWKEYIYTHDPEGKYKRYNTDGQVDESKCGTCHMCDSEVFCVSCCMKSMGMFR